MNFQDSNKPDCKQRRRLRQVRGNPRKEAASSVSSLLLSHLIPAPPCSGCEATSGGRNESASSSQSPSPSQQRRDRCAIDVAQRREKAASRWAAFVCWQRQLAAAAAAFAAAAAASPASSVKFNVGANTNTKTNFNKALVASTRAAESRAKRT